MDAPASDDQDQLLSQEFDHVLAGTNFVSFNTFFL